MVSVSLMRASRVTVAPHSDHSNMSYRVIVDEAQNIKNHTTKSALGALHLKGDYRLAMTGTPMMNGVSELFSLIRFLRISPYNSLETFNYKFKRPLESSNEHDTLRRSNAMKALQVLLKSIMLRRTKTSEIDGNPILNLKERTTEIAHAVFDEEQAGFYKALELQVGSEPGRDFSASSLFIADPDPSKQIPAGGQSPQELQLCSCAAFASSSGVRPPSFDQRLRRRCLCRNVS